jgi:hypothetical protein
LLRVARNYVVRYCIGSARGAQKAPPY